MFRVLAYRKTILLFLLLISVFTSVALPPPQLNAQTSSNINKIWASAYLYPAYQEWKRRYVLSNGMVYSYDWSHNQYGKYYPHPNSALTEGQSYAMTMAVYMNDPTTFARVWGWTKANMQTRQDHLFNWWTGTRPDGSYGPVVNGDATDGDELIGYALMKAGERWGRTDYLQEGINVASDLWRENVVQCPYNKRYYIGMSNTGDVRWITNLIVDPSYCMPYVYRTFAKYDTTHSAGWQQLYVDAYDVLYRCSTLHADNLVPHVCYVNMKNAAVSRAWDTNFSSDSERAYWHVGIEASNGDPHARWFLWSHNFLTNYMQKHPIMPRIFLSTGPAVPLNGNDFADDVTMLTLAQMNLLAPTQVKTYYDKLLLARQKYYNGLWDSSKSYYVPAVAWFALYAIANG